MCTGLDMMLKYCWIGSILLAYELHAQEGGAWISFILFVTLQHVTSIENKSRGIMFK